MLKKGLQFPVLLFFSFMSFAFFWALVNANGASTILEIELFRGSSLNFSFSLILDKIRIRFGIVVTLISGRVFTFAHKYIEEDHFSDRFLWILMAFVLRMNFLTLSGSLLFLLLGWDGLGITSFALIIYYQRRESLTAGFQTLIINRLGDALIVLSTFLFVLSQQFSFYSMEDYFFRIGLVLILALAGLTKRAQYPFRAWLPAAMAAPTPVRALVHSSTLVTAGIFLIIRLSYNIPLDYMCKSILIFTGSVTCLLGGWAATFENDLKKVIALSTLSQLGVMVFSLGLGLPNLALFHLYTHALFKALLFLAAGNILMSSYGSQDIRLLGGIGIRIPYTIVIFNVRSLCLVGGPFLSAFYSKHLILEIRASSSISLISFIIIIAATFFTAKYVVRTLKCVSWFKPVASILRVQSNFFTVFPVTVLSIGGIIGGKLFGHIDLINIEVATISYFWSILINLVTISGLTAGFLSSGSKNRFFLSTLFFLSPRLRVKPFKLVKTLRSLDYGWLEPSNRVSILNKARKLSSLGNWPEKQVFVRVFLRIYLISVIVVYV